MSHDKTTPHGSFFKSATRWRICVPEQKETQIVWTKKAKLLAKAQLVLASIDWSFDNLLYPTVLLLLGPLMGGVIMTVLAALACYVILAYYIQSKEDWLGVDVIETIKEQGGKWVERLYSKQGYRWKIVHLLAFVPAKIFLLVLWLLKKNDVVAFITLSIYTDGFRATAFLRHGRKGPLTRRDWAIFWSSIVISNLWWTLRWSLIIEVAKRLLW